MILAGDVGGTKTNLAFFDPRDLRNPVAAQKYPSAGYPGLEAILGAFLAAAGHSPTLACFGVAGPVRNGRCEATNLAWVVDSRQLAQALTLPRVALINDLEANAYGIAALGETNFVVLQRGAPGAAGSQAIIAAGTGLGEAGLYWDGRTHHPFPCEGGHSDFSPNSDVEVELLGWLRKKWEHVSWERVLSGPGLHNLYDFLRDTGRGEEPAWLAEQIRTGDPNAAIAQAGLAGTCALCTQALDLFVRLYGSEAGNLALKIGAAGGVYIGGGIAPKILAKLKEGAFLEAFIAKGRMRSILEAVPIRVILNDRTALLGAARCAAGKDEG